MKKALDYASDYQLKSACKDAIYIAPYKVTQMIFAVLENWAACVSFAWGLNRKVKPKVKHVGHKANWPRLLTALCSQNTPKMRPCPREHTSAQNTSHSNICSRLCAIQITVECDLKMDDNDTSDSIGCPANL